MNILINLERDKIARQLELGIIQGRYYLGIRFYSDKLVKDRKKNSNKTIRQILLDLANEDAQSV